MADKWLANYNWSGTRADQHTGYLPKGGPTHELNIWDNIKTILGLQASRFAPVQSINPITVTGKNQVNQGDTVNKIGEIKIAGKDLSKGKTTSTVSQAQPKATPGQSNGANKTVPKTSTKINKPPISASKPAAKTAAPKTTPAKVTTTTSKTSTGTNKPSTNPTRTELTKKWGEAVAAKANASKPKVVTSSKNVVPPKTNVVLPDTSVKTEEDYLRELAQARDAQIGIQTPMKSISANQWRRTPGTLIMENGGKFIDNLIQEFKKGGGIHIKPENKGKFTATKKATGKTTEELTHSKNPVTKKRAIFAQNAKKWKHKDGGVINFDLSNILNKWTK